jgi:two-component system, chemotaxis family, chemotaxis protein CheY
MACKIVTFVSHYLEAKAPSEVPTPVEDSTGASSVDKGQDCMIESPSMSILVVEDSNATGRIICNMLKHTRFQKIDLAPGGVSALSKMCDRDYGLVISDWNMHPMSRLELLKEIRSEPAFAKTRFLMITAESSMDHVVAARSAGANGFMVKPFTAQTLKDKIEPLCADWEHSHDTVALRSAP